MKQLHIIYPKTTKHFSSNRHIEFLGALAQTLILKGTWAFFVCPKQPGKNGNSTKLTTNCSFYIVSGGDTIGVNELVLNSKAEDVNLIDLLSERHNMLRKISEKTWNNRSEMYISNAEWYILARIYKNRPTISELTKNVEISRQAIHKHVKNLSAKGLVEVKNVEYNKKEKCIELTESGEECYEKYDVLKAQLEQQIAEKIGGEQVKILKNLLKIDWGIK